MQKTDALKKKLQTLRINVSNEELNILVSYGQEIEKQPKEMVNPSLSLSLKRLGTLFYSKEIDITTVSEFVSQIQKKRGKISVKEIDYVFQEIIDNKTDINTFFKLSEILRIIDAYLVKKAKVARVSYEIHNENKKVEEFANEANQFLQDAVKKWKDGKELTIYEKCAIGKRHEFDVRNADILKEQAENDLDQENSKIVTRHKNEHFGLFIDESQNIPVFWTKELLYHFYLFTHL
jgi:hypothetical protein